jgi:hypothetical protein
MIFLHPDKAIDGVYMKHLFAGNGKDFFRSEFLTERAALGFGAGALPGNEGVEPLTVLIQGHAVHAQTGYGNTLDVGGLADFV